jgi:hypothetical protein
VKFSWLAPVVFTSLCWRGFSTLKSCVSVLWFFLVLHYCLSHFITTSSWPIQLSRRGGHHRLTDSSTRQLSKLKQTLTTVTKRGATQREQDLSAPPLSTVPLGELDQQPSGSPLPPADRPPPWRLPRLGATRRRPPAQSRRPGVRPRSWRGAPGSAPLPDREDGSVDQGTLRACDVGREEDGKGRGLGRWRSRDPPKPPYAGVERNSCVIS